MRAPYVAHPRGEDDRKARAVGDGGVEGGELMFHPVARPVTVARAGDVEAATCESVVRERAHPHEVRTSVVVARVLHDAGRCLHRRADEPAGDVVGHGHGGLPREEALHHVADHIGDARGGLVRRQREGELGIHDGHSGAVEVGVDAALHAQLVV